MNGRLADECLSCHEGVAALKNLRTRAPPVKNSCPRIKTKRMK